MSSVFFLFWQAAESNFPFPIRELVLEECDIEKNVIGSQSMLSFSWFMGLSIHQEIHTKEKLSNLMKTEQLLVKRACFFYSSQFSMLYVTFCAAPPNFLLPISNDNNQFLHRAGADTEHGPL